MPGRESANSIALDLVLSPSKKGTADNVEETKVQNNGSKEETKEKNKGSKEETKEKNKGSKEETKEKNKGPTEETEEENKGSTEETEEENKGSTEETEEKNKGSTEETEEENNGSKVEMGAATDNGSEEQIIEKNNKPSDQCEADLILSDFIMAKELQARYDAEADQSKVLDLSTKGEGNNNVEKPYVSNEEWKVRHGIGLTSHIPEGDSYNYGSGFGNYKRPGPSPTPEQDSKTGSSPQKKLKRKNASDIPKGLDQNYRFLMNEIKSQPDGDYVETIHQKWKGDYVRLEEHHGYIQWLFPLPTTGKNNKAQALNEQEIEVIRGSVEARHHLQCSYMLMLDFFGMELINSDRGLVARAGNWEERFRHLNASPHNFLRLTRIIRCLGLLGFEHYQQPLLEFCIREVFLYKTLSSAETSCLHHWIPAATADLHERDILFELAEKCISQNQSDNMENKAEAAVEEVEEEKTDKVEDTRHFKKTMLDKHRNRKH